MKYLFLSLILPLNSVFIGSEYSDYGAPSDAITCANEKHSVSFADCSTGIADASLDNAGNVPDSCCKVDNYDMFCDGHYGCSGEDEGYCLQIKKDRAEDYIDYIYRNSNLEYPDKIKIICNGVTVIDWTRYSGSFYKSSIKLSLLILFLLV